MWPIIIIALNRLTLVSNVGCMLVRVKKIICHMFGLQSEVILFKISVEILNLTINFILLFFFFVLLLLLLRSLFPLIINIYSIIVDEMWKWAIIAKSRWVGSTPHPKHWMITYHVHSLSKCYFKLCASLIFVTVVVVILVIVFCSTIVC